MKKIIIVDDEQEMTQLLMIELESEGYQILVCHDGLSGLNLIREERPDLVILDIMLPKMDGYEVLRALKEDSMTKHIPIIMLTAKGLEEEIQKGLDLGVDDYVSKPFHSGLLLKRIKSIFDN